MHERMERADGTGGWIAARSGDDWMLIGSHCRTCDRVAAPSDRFGCLNCGAAPTEIDIIPLSGRGTLVNAITVFQPLIPNVDVPVVIGAIALDEGPVVSAQIAAAGEVPPSGMILQAGMVGADGTVAGAWHFFPTEEAAS